MASKPSPMYPHSFRSTFSGALFATLAILSASTAPAHAYGDQFIPINGSNPSYGNNHVYYQNIFGLGNLYASGYYTQNTYNAPPSNALNSLDGQITGSPNMAGSGNNLEWAAGLLDYVGNLGGGSANITVPSGQTVNGIYNGNGWGSAAGIYTTLGNGNRGTTALSVNNSGTVNGTVNVNDGVAAGIISYVNIGDQTFTNNTNSNITANASWFTSGIRAATYQGNINVNQYGSLTAECSGSFQYPYNNRGSQGWAVGLDLQTYGAGNVNVYNSGVTSGKNDSRATGPDEACGAYLWVNGGGQDYYNSNLNVNNTGTFTASAPGTVKGIYCGTNGSYVNFTNSGLISANSSTGQGYALGVEIDGPGTMTITNTGTINTNAGYGAYVVSTTSSDPNSGGTGPVRIENWGYIQGGNNGINSGYYHGPITICDHGANSGNGGTIIGNNTNPSTGGGAIFLDNSRANNVYLYGRPSIGGQIYSAPGGTLHLQITSPITGISGTHSNTAADLSSDGLGSSGTITTADGHSYTWNNMGVTGHTARQDIANRTYYIVNRNSPSGGKNVLDEPGGQTGNGTGIWQWGINYQANQQWQVTNLGGGLYSIVNKASGRALEDYNSNLNNGNKINIWDWNGNANQKWLFTATDSGFFTISPACAPNSCLDVPSASQSAGVYLQLYTLADFDTWPGGGAGQQWALQPA